MNLEEREALLAEGQKLKYAFRLAEALEVFLRLEKIQEESEPDVGRRALHLNRIASVALRLHRYPEAERAARKCVEIHLAAGLPIDTRYATYLGMLAGVLAERGKLDEAVPFQRESNAIHERFLEPDSSFLMWRRIDLLHMQQGRIGKYIGR